MAQASLEPTVRYFCHQCDQNIEPLPEFICPRCQSGFIEEISTENNSVEILEPDESSSDSVQAVGGQLADALEDIYGQYSGNPRRSTRPTTEGSRLNSGYYPPNPQRPTRGARGQQGNVHNVELNGLLQQVLASLSNAQPSAEGFGGGMFTFPGGSAPSVAGQVTLDFPLFQMLHGNPGDYAWGQSGLDAVITQLLNQLDSTGPSPMTDQEIEKLVTINITKDDVENNLQCTVCMEDYKLDENVKKLSCGHVFHPECIVPWLKRHATCPVCRLNLNSNNETSTNTSGSGPGSDGGSLGGSSSSGQSHTGTYYDILDYD
ncbi:E3 ubiquitin-protein ligase [Halotydeus destructor]|nr:E3 ubiquitin-protein ligase [Halotydeus destructor]